MSFQSQLKHRCEVSNLVEVVEDGASSYVFEIKIPDLRCFLDLKALTEVDPYFVPAAGRPTERAGTLFVLPKTDGSCPVKPGDSITITRGPSGTFEINNMIDEIWTPHRLHHYEIGCTEVAPQIARKRETNDPTL